MLCDHRVSRVCDVIVAAAATRCGMRRTQHTAPFQPRPSENLVFAPAAVQEHLGRSAQPITFAIDTTEYECTHERISDEGAFAESSPLLGPRRAKANQQSLITPGVPAVQLQTVTFCESKPVCTCVDPSCRERNLRVEVSAAVPATIGCAQ
jgi:hypothetical protein